MKKQNNKKPLLGIDMTNSAFNMMALQHTEQGYQPSHFTSIPLPADFNAAAFDHEREKLGEAASQIQQALAPFAKHEVGIALPDDGVVFGHCNVRTHLKPKEIIYQILLESENFLEDNLSEVCLDYHLVTAKKSQINREEAIYYLCQRPLVEAYKNFFEGFGVSVRFADVAHLARLRAWLQLFRDEYVDHVIVMMELGYDKFIMNVYDDDHVILCDTLKFTPTQDTSLENHHQQACEQISDYLQTLLKKENCAAVSGVYCCGDLATKDFIQQLRGNIAQPIVAADPFRKLQAPGPSFQMLKQPSNLLTACGLALRLQAHDQR